jgi:hypothetical protein
MVSRTTPEGAVQHAVLDYLARLELQGKLIFWRTNNTGVWDARRQCYRKPQGPGARLGVPDIMVVVPPLGRLVALECKAPKGVQSKPQEGFQRAHEAIGGIYAVVRSLADAEAALSQALTSDRA